MPAPRATGFIRVVPLAGGDAFYAQIRTADARRLQRRLGKVWGKRSRPPAGYLTRAQAEARLQTMLEGGDEAVPVDPPLDAMPTFGAAGREWLIYIEEDRKRRPSTVQDYRRELERVLIPAFGEDTSLDEIDTARVDAYRSKLVAEGRLSARTINKRLAQLHAIFKRAQRVHGLAVNPVTWVERQPYRRSGDFAALSAGGHGTRREGGKRPRRRAVHDRRLHRPAARRASRTAMGGRGLVAAARPRPAFVHARGKRAAEVGEGPLGPAGRSGRSGVPTSKKPGALHRRRRSCLRQRPGSAVRGVRNAAALLFRSQSYGPAAHCGTPSAPSRCRCSR
jgi:Phage integrase, N-terminal SAM-like domain